jgi:tetratricopeptide (TPR) repeat protein
MNNDLTGRTTESEKQRVIRVFISSTFKDMAEEREELMKFVFPELRKRCRERRVEFVGVDLRWGITDEQKAEGKVLPICLAEIERCRPYFIALIGERYGWVPDSIDKELEDTHPLLKAHQGKSVTELEIWHGVLTDKKMKNLTYFYFRNKQKSLEIEKVLSRETSYIPEPQTSKDKLVILKHSIVKSGYPMKTDYPDSKALGRMVIDDLWAAIDARYPIEEVPTELEQRRLEHEAFASLRTDVYIDIGRQEYFKRLNNHVQSDDPPLVILGESGSGKSALIAKWSKEYQNTHPGTFIITHYIGSTADSTDYIQMLRRIIEEIRAHLVPETAVKEKGIAYSGLSSDYNNIPTDPKKIREAFPLWLARIAAKEKLILIIDALNQLEDRDNALELGWLPRTFSPSVRVILSTLPGRSLKALKKRNWPEMTIALMERREQEEYIHKYLAKYRKNLETAQVAKIVAAPQTANPLYLRTLLEELRVFGVYEKLNDRIDYYLHALTPDALFNLVLDRLAHDYEQEKPGLVREVMSFIWASRRGIAETEILELLGQKGNPMPRAIWAPLFLALEDYLVCRSGLLTFFHEFLRKAVECRYLNNDSDKKKVHLQLSDYFETKNLDDRKVDELPWQLAQSESWNRLYEKLSDLDFFSIAWAKDSYDVKVYWSLIEAASGLKKIDAYKNVIEQPDKYQKHIWALGILLADTGALEASLKLKKFSIEYYRRISDLPNLQAIIGNYAVSLLRIGKDRTAEALFQEQEDICRKNKMQNGLPVIVFYQGLSLAVYNRGLIFHRRKDLKNAMALYKESELLAESNHDLSILALSKGRMATIYREWGKYDEALSLHREEESISCEIGDFNALQASFGNQALVYINLNQIEVAVDLLKRQQKICCDIGYKEDLVNSYYNEALLLLQNSGSPDEVLLIIEQAYKVAVENDLKSIAGEIEPFLIHVKQIAMH